MVEVKYNYQVLPQVYYMQVKGAWSAGICISTRGTDAGPVGIGSVTLVTVATCRNMLQHLTTLRNDNTLKYSQYICFQSFYQYLSILKLIVWLVWFIAAKFEVDIS